MSHPIQAALIGGLGYAATVFHTPLLRSLPDLFTLVHVVDVLHHSNNDDKSNSEDPRKQLPPSFVETFGPTVKFSTRFNDTLEDATIELVRLYSISTEGD
jgi:hypothetical protein